MITFNNKVVTYNHKWINGSGSPVDPYNPLNLPPNTFRVRTNDGEPPVKTETVTTYETATLVPGTSDIYDVYKSGTSLYNMFYGSSNVVEVLGANTSNITSMWQMFIYCSSLTTVALFDTSSVTTMEYMFNNCTSLTSVPLFDTSNVTNMAGMFSYCSSLTSVPLFNTSNVTTMSIMFSGCSNLGPTIPLFDTSKVTNMSHMFSGCSSIESIPLIDTSSVTNMNNMFMFCYYVQSGSLALYQQASTQTNPPSNHDRTFSNCGSNTQTGAAELAQIPSDWK